MVPKAAGPTVIERYAAAQRFRKDKDGRFFHEDGSWIDKVTGGSFPWERRTAMGELVRLYWAKDHCLQLAPLELEADIWGLMQAHPQRHSLLLVDVDGRTVEVTGEHLNAMVNAGDVTIYPASYRLVVHDGRGE